MIAVALLAAVVYVVLRSIERRRAGGSPAPGTRRGPRPKPRMVAPDDDEDFLRGLDRKRPEDSPE